MIAFDRRTQRRMTGVDSTFSPLSRPWRTSSVWRTARAVAPMHAIWRWSAVTDWSKQRKEAAT